MKNTFLFIENEVECREGGKVIKKSEKDNSLPLRNQKSEEGSNE